MVVEMLKTFSHFLKREDVNSSMKTTPSLMDLASGIFSAVFGLYRNINPSTLSGVNDVIVVEGEDGVLRCSPFLVRFGKMRMFRVTSRTVHIYVNGMITDVSMVIGKQGELYFEVEEPKKPQETYPHVDIKYAKEMPEERCNFGDIGMLDGFYPTKNGYIPHETPVYGCLNDGPKVLYTKKFVEHERSTNLEKRKFFRKHGKEDVDPYENLKSIHGNLEKLINSFEYFDFVCKNVRRLLHILKGLWCHPANTGLDCTGNFSRSCKEAKIRFSLCGSQRIDKDIESIFDGCEVQRVRDHDRLLVQVSGCKACRVKFYFGFNFFSELHFMIKTVLCKKSQERQLSHILEKEKETRKKWSFFGRSKTQQGPAWSFELSSDQLKSMNLRYGSNSLVFKLSGINQKLDAKIFLWRYTEKIIVSDVDGTITKSDVRGHIYGLVGKDWTHKGVVNLYSRIVRNGYKVLYLTTRPLGQSSMTRLYLKNIEQDGGKLPEGPIIHSPDGFFGSIYREIISRNPQSFKISCLEKIQSLFGDEFPFVSGFGNKLTDVITYKTVRIPASKIFTINPQGNIILELTKSLTATHHSLNEFVDSMFPKLNIGLVIDFDNKFTDSSFWKLPEERFKSE